jgi:hypothetical protein
MANTTHDPACLASLTSSNACTKGKTKGSKTNKKTLAFAQKTKTRGRTILKEL